MYRLSINKELFEDVLLKKIFVLKKENTSYWKRELIEPKIVNDKLIYGVRSFEKILITNGLGKKKPQLIVECLNINYSIENGYFEFHLGKIIEQKNINIKENNKDKIIEQIIEENKKLKEKVKMVQKKIDF